MDLKAKKKKKMKINQIIKVTKKSGKKWSREKGGPN